MASGNDLTDPIRSIGFACSRCGSCCRDISPDSDRVMLSRDEVKSIVPSTGLPWDRIAGPYPEAITHRSRVRVNIGWCLRRANRRCRFHHKDHCAIDNNRLWICRTYPFVPDNGKVVVNSCERAGAPFPWQEAGTIAGNFLARRHAENQEGVKGKKVRGTVTCPAEVFAGIDADGAWVIDG